MPIYKCTAYFNNRKQYEVEAADKDSAYQKASDLCYDEESPEEIVDMDIVLADCQYTDAEELRDRERDFENK